MSSNSIDGTSQSLADTIVDQIFDTISRIIGFVLTDTVKKNNNGSIDGITNHR